MHDKSTTIIGFDPKIGLFSVEPTNTKSLLRGTALSPVSPKITLHSSAKKPSPTSQPVPPMEPKMRKTYNRATFNERMQIHALLSQHLHKNEETGFWAYDFGWNDETIAKKVNPALSAGAAQYVRATAFGRLFVRKTEKPVTNDAEIKGLAELHEKLDRIENMLSRLNDVWGVK